MTGGELSDRGRDLLAEVPKSSEECHTGDEWDTHFHHRPGKWHSELEQHSSEVTVME